MAEEYKKHEVLSIFKGALISVISALVMILLFSLILKLLLLSSAVIKPVNQFIKAVAIFIGAVFCLKGKLGFLKGTFLGALFTILIYLIFSLILGETSFNSQFLIDLAFGIIIGAIAGIITINLKK